MAIHPTVLGTTDGRWRIEADASGQQFTVYCEGQLRTKVTSLPALADYLAANGVDLADLTER